MAHSLNMKSLICTLIPIKIPFGIIISYSLFMEKYKTEFSQFLLYWNKILYFLQQQQFIQSISIVFYIGLFVKQENEQKFQKIAFNLSTVID